MSDSSSQSTPNGRKTGPGSRIKGARAKGLAAAKDGDDVNPYHAKRPGMVKAWAEGFDSYEEESA